MDIIVKTVLDKFQSQEGFENTVIAGGAVRDYTYGLVPRDYDIFIPAKSPSLVVEAVNKVKEALGMEVPVVNKGTDYGDHSYISQVMNFVFEGKEFDIIGKPFDNDDEFGAKVVAQFDFGYNMGIYNGLFIDDSNEHFKNDTQYGYGTLVNLEGGIHSLPHVMKRFFNFDDKLYEEKKYRMLFRAPCLEQPKPKKNPWVQSSYQVHREFQMPEPVNVANIPAPGEVPRFEEVARQLQIQGEWEFPDPIPLVPQQEVGIRVDRANLQNAVIDIAAREREAAARVRNILGNNQNN